MNNTNTEKYTKLCPTCNAIQDYITHADYEIAKKNNTRCIECVKHDTKTINNFYRFVVQDKMTNCHEYIGGKDKDGYGLFNLYNNKQIRAHRYSYELNCGKIPNGYNVLHKCDNPSCVNPMHLWMGTQADNMRDKCYKQRQASKLTEEQVKNIRNNTVTKKTLLAKLYNVSVVTIYEIQKGITWKHI